MIDSVFQTTDSDGGISPVIGVILMVVIVVVLAALIGVYALALSDGTESNVTAGIETDTTDEGVQVRLNSTGNAEEVEVFVNGSRVDGAQLTGVGDSVTVATGADDTVTVVGVGPDGNEDTLQTVEPEEDTTGGSGDPQVVSGGSESGTTGEEVTGLVRVNPPIEDATVISYDADGNQLATTTTDSEGNYTVETVENGRVVVSVDGSDSYNGNPLYAGAAKTVSDTSSSLEFDFDETQVSTATVNGETVSVVYQTDGSSSNQIANVGQLQALTAPANSDKSYELVRDVDASGTSSWNGGNGFEPITGFSGSVNGQGYAIDGLTIDREDKDNGLFRKVTDGSISNLTVSNADIVGGFVNGILGAELDNTEVSNVRVSGSIQAFGDGDFNSHTGGLAGIVTNNSTITESTTEIQLSGDAEIGGFVGQNINNSTINKSYATGSIDNDYQTGGFVAFNSGTIKNSYTKVDMNTNTGESADQIGGFIETNSGTLENVYTAADMSDTDGSQDGGFYSADSQVDTTTGTYWDRSTTGLDVPSNDYYGDHTRGNGSVIRAFGVAYGYESDDLTGSDAVCTFIEFDFGEVWSTTSSYPQLIDNPESESAIQDSQPSCEYQEAFNNMSGAGTESNPYQITNLDQLQAMKYDTSAHYQLQNDIDATPTQSWNDGKGFEPVNRRIGVFTGSFDGNGHTIDGLYINRTSVGNHASLLGTINGAEITDLTMTNVDITGRDKFGSVASTSVDEGGAESITISNVHVSGSLAATLDEPESTGGGLIGSLNSGSVIEQSSADVQLDLGNGAVGGLVQDTDDNSTIKQSYVKGTITGGANGGGIADSIGTGSIVINSYTKVDVQSDAQQIGGIATGNDGTVENVYVAGSVNDTFQSAAGFSAGSSVIDVYWDAEATGRSQFSDDGSSDEDVKLTTSEMQGSSAKSNMSGLDFDSVWTTTSGYPELQNNPE